MDDDRIIRIARALCRSARMDPDSIVAAEPVDASRAHPERRGLTVVRAPAWTLYREAAVTFIRSHDAQVVAPL